MSLPKGWSLVDEQRRPRLPLGWEPVDEASPNGGTVAQTGKAVARGATAEGIYAAAEGVARVVANLPRTGAAVIETLEGLRDRELPADEQAARAAARQERYARRLADIPAEAPAAGAVLAAAEGYADQTRSLREQIREALPIDQEFARSKLGQIAQGLGQAAGTLPLYVTPAAGAAASVGQIYTEAYDDAKAAGADDATAHTAAMKYLPASGLDYLADSLVVGKVLKPLKGKVSVGRVLADIGVAAAAEGATEGAQQLYLNQIARRLQGYDPERPFDQEVYDSVLVGAVVGGGVTATGAAVGSVIPRENAPAPSLPAETQPAARDSAAPSSEAKPGAASPGLPPGWTAADGPASAGGAVDPVAGAVPDNLPPTPPPAAPPALPAFQPSTRPLSEESRLVEAKFGEQLAADPEASALQYEQRNTRNGVLVIDPDEVRNLSADYAQDPALSPAVHEPASNFSKWLFRRQLAKPPTGVAVFMAGGGGSGKTTARNVIPELQTGAEFVYDSVLGTFSKPDGMGAKEMIDAALASGRRVRINYIFTPEARAWRQVQERFLREKRPVPFEEFKLGHLKSFLTTIKLARAYEGNPGVEFRIVDNTGELGKPTLTNLDAVLEMVRGEVGISEQQADSITQELKGQNEPRTQQGAAEGGDQYPRDQGAQPAPRAAPAGEAQAPGSADAGGGSRGPGDRAGAQPGGPEAVGAAPASSAIVEFPLAQIVVNKDVKQFKADADPETGVVEKLQGRFRREPIVRQILLWQKANGEHEIVTGRHKLDLARRSGETTIPAQILREADGWTLERVRAVDAEVNIRGGQGRVKDFAQYFRTARELTAQQAEERGLLSRAPGQSGWALGRLATDPLWDLYANNQIAEPKAVAIARGAPNHDAAQASAIRQAKNRTAAELELYARNLARSADRASAAEQLGFAGVAQDFADFEREAEAVAKVQAAQISERRALVEAAAGAARRPEAARKMGLPVDDPAALQARIQQLRDEIAALENPDERAYQDLRQAAGLPRQDPVAPADDAPPAPPPEDPNQTGLFARRRAPVAPAADQGDMFSGGETGGDVLFNLQGEEAKDYSGIVDQQAETAAARKKADADQFSLFARRSPDQVLEERARLEQLRGRWRAEAERIAPGLMARFGLKFGDPDVLVAAGKVRPEELTGWEQAYYDGHERMLYLFDQALASNQELFTRVNLLHEMGHAHWDTLPASRQQELALEWEKEVAARTGPLFERGQLRAGVAQGIEADIKEWYAERVAWANHDWARKRAAGEDVRISGPVGRAAQQLRILLQQLQEWLGQLRGSPVDLDFRRFLDQGERFAPAAPLQLAAFARRVVPGSAHSAPNVAQRMRAAAEDVRSWLQRELTSRGHLPASVAEARLERRAGVVAVERQVQFALRDLDAAVRAVYGGWSAVPAAEQTRLNDVLGGRAAVGTLDARLQAPVASMRRQVDELSRRLIREGVVSGDLASRIAGNVGFYLNRSYRKFDDADWAAKVPPAVLARASSFLRAELRADVVDRLADRDYNLARGFPPGSPAYRADPLWQQIRQGHDANQAIQPDEARVQGLVEYLLSKDVDGPAALFNPGLDGRKDLSIVTRRKEIAPEIRELLGEYQDVRVNFARSMAKTAQLLESHRFLTEARRAGLGSFFHEAPLPGYAVRIAAPGSQALAPLNGLYTSPEIADAFARAFDERAPQNPAWRLFLALNGWTKMAKTVLHPVTQVRNFVANFGFLVANGHYHAADGGAAVLTAMRAELGRGDQAARDYVQRLARLGVVGESTAANELAEAMGDAGVKMTGVEEFTDSAIARAAKLPFRAAQRLYQANDELFKIYAFENEVRAWRAALPGASAEQVDRLAAERVRNTLPTYSQVPLLVQRIRRAALLGSFVSFPSEVVRTGYHTIRYAMTDLRSNNPAVRAIGARRLAGIAVAAGLTSAISAVSRSLAELDDRDEQDLRRFLPEWNQNAQLLFTGRGAHGRFSLVDLSYLDPWAYLRKPVLAAMRSESWPDALGAAALEASSPFLQEGVLAKVLLDISRNQTDTGRPVYNPQAGPIDRQLAKVAHLWTALEPGAVTQARRMVRAAKGEVSASGRAYRLEEELLALTTGARSQSVNVAQAHAFQAGRYSSGLQLANTTYRRVRDRQGTVDPEEVAAARQDLDRTRAQLFAEMVADNRAAARLGVDRAQLLFNLRAAGLSQAEAGAVLAERPLPYIERPVDAVRQVQRQLLERR